MKLKRNKLTIEQLHVFLKSPLELDDFKDRATRIINGENVRELFMCDYCKKNLCNNMCASSLRECNNIRREFFKKLNVVCD